MMRWLALLTLLVLPTSSFANQVMVSVGQLSDATRLVLTFEERPEWTTVLADGQLVLSFQDDRIDVSAVVSNAFLADTRIANLTTADDGTTLGITYNCNCVPKVFAYGSESLVIELRDNVALSRVGEVQTTSPVQPEIPRQSSLPVGRAAQDPTIANRASSDIPPADTIVVYPPNPPNFGWKPTRTELDLVATLGVAMDLSDGRAVQLISRELSRAAAQGLINATDTSSERRTNGETPGSLSAIEGRSNLSVVTSVDRDVFRTRDVVRPTNQGAICFSDSEVDLTAWGDTAEFATLGRLRRDALAENGEVQAAGALAIARYYIALGFGSEAKVAAKFAKDGARKDLILAMADIVDHGFSDASILEGQIFCDGKVALWAALAKPIDAASAPTSVKIILQTFSALPTHIRAHLGPVLAERLRSIGLEDEARNAVNAVARGGMQSNESELVSARLELGGTRPDKARQTLTSISNGTDVTAAEALLELLLDAERRDMAPNPAWVEDAPSLARATEGTDVAAAVNLAGLRGRIALGQFDKLRKALGEETPGLTDGTRNDLSISALVAAAKKADDLTFLKSELGFSKLQNIGDIPREGRLEIAERLSNLGLAARAEAYLPSTPTGNDEVGTVAKVLANLGREDQAIQLLSIVEDGESTRQLGETLAQAGMDSAAIEAFQDGGFVDEAIRAAIRAGDWDWISSNADQDSDVGLSAATRALTAPAVQPSSFNEPINGALIATSRDRRRGARTLLEQTNLSGGS